MLEVSANKIEQTTEQTLVGQCLFDGAISIKRNYKCGKSNGKECGGEQIRKTGRLLRSLQEATRLPNTFTTHSRAQAWSQPASQPANCAQLVAGRAAEQTARGLFGKALPDFTAKVVGGWP